MTVLLTVLSGVLVYVLGQLALKLVIEPGYEYKKTVADIAHALLLYDNVYGSGDKGKMDEAHAELRKLSARLYAHICLINFITSWIFRVPDRTSIYDAIEHLIGLSNSVYGSAGDQSPEAALKRAAAIVSRIKRISDALGIHNPLTGSPE